MTKLYSTYEKIDLAPNKDLFRKYVWNTYGRANDCYVSKVVHSEKIERIEKPSLVGRYDKVKEMQCKETGKFSWIY